MLGLPTMPLASVNMEGGIWLVLGTLLLLIALGAPLFVILGLVVTTAIIAFPEMEGVTESLEGFTNNWNVMESVGKIADEPAFVAIPFFMVAGALMSRGAIAKRLVDLATATVGWLPGGMALTTVAACVLFAAISGSSPVTVITIGAIMLPALEKAGYDEKMRVGLVTSAGTLGIIIPPSIPMIVYAIYSTSAGHAVSSEELFIAGIGPGVVIVLMFGAYCIARGWGIARIPFNWGRLKRAFLDGFWGIFLPFFIIGGIYAGLFGATEASAISVVLALIIELFIHRSLKLEDLPGILAESAVLMGSILIIIAVGFGFSELLTFKQIPQQIVHWLADFELTPITFVLLLNLLLLVVGCLMDIISAIILFVPLLVPIAATLNFDPVHLGLIFIVNLEIGYLTPPLGLNLFVAATYFRKPFGLVIRAVLPYLGMLVASLAIVTYVPTVSVGLVNLMEPGRKHAPPPSKDGESTWWSPFPHGTVLQPSTAGPSAEEALDAEADLFDDPDFGETGATGSDGDDESIKDLMKDPEYLKMMQEMGEGTEAAPPGDPEPEADDDGDASIKDLMKDPEYRRLMQEMQAEGTEETAPKISPETPSAPKPPESPSGEDPSIKDLMKDPEYRKLMREMQQD